MGKLPVPALGRAVEVLDLLAGAAAPLGLSALARQTGIAKSTLHGLCETLCSLGLALQEPAGFSIGPKALLWSGAWLRGNDLARGFARICAADQSLAEHTLTLSMLDGADVVYIGCNNAARPLGLTFRIGMRLPAVFTATGKAMLAALPKEQRQNHLPKVWPERLTPKSCPSPEAFAQEIEEWQRLGHGVDAGQVREGMTCVGLALKNRAGEVVAGLAISMTEVEARSQGTKALAAKIETLAKPLMEMV